MQQQPSSGNNSDEIAEDIQIAWENLEAARAIVEKMLLATHAKQTAGGASTALSDAEEVKFQL